jgi:hypothetical protein
MITTQRPVDPLVLLLGSGGSVATAMRIMGDVLQELADQGVPRDRLIATWVAVHAEHGAQEWDPTDPIPRGTILLRCTGWSASDDDGQ